VVNVDDLPLEVWHDIATAADTGWWNVNAAPAIYPLGAIALLAACAKHVGEEPPPSGYLTAGNILNVFEKIPDDLPGSFEDGIPKAEAGPGTTSSSGVSESSAGPQTSSDGKQSATSVS
jgi:hypothetical protein